MPVAVLVETTTVAAALVVVAVAAEETVVAVAAEETVVAGVREAEVEVREEPVAELERVADEQGATQLQYHVRQ